MDYKKESKFIYDFTKQVIDEVGPRLPGSAAETKAVPIIANEMKKATGVEAIVEPFTLSPNASIGAIPILGIVGYLATFMFYLSPIASLIIGVLGFSFAILQIFCYTGVFDKLFPKATSHNVYSVMEPTSGKVDYTLVFSGHNDSSWNWNFAEKKPQTMIIKTILGTLGVAYMCVLSIIAICLEFYTFKAISSEMSIFAMILYCLPVFTLLTNYWLLNFLSWDPKLASPGAMDNLTGVGLSIVMGKYFKENMKKFPNARIIIMGIGAEEAGLKGSTAFIKKHAGNDSLLINPYVINLDSFRDFDHFNIVKGDLWLFSRFDENMREIGLKVFDDIGLKPSIIINPVGGCDSTPFARKGIKTITFCAQNPVASSYYHTKNDHYTGLDMNTLEKSCELIEKYTIALVDDITSKIK